MNRVRVDIPYQEKHSRLSVLLRPILAFPIMVIMFLMIVPNHSINLFRVADVVETQTIDTETNYYDFTGVVIQGAKTVVDHIPQGTISDGQQEQVQNALVATGIYLSAYLLIIPLIAFSFWFFYVVNVSLVLTLLFRKKYPNWWFNWNQSLQSFVLRIYCYSMFLTDKYPSLDAEDSHIKLHLPNPASQELNRFLPLVKWLLVAPMLLLYMVCLVVSFLLIPLSFISILVLGKLPRWIHRVQVAIIHFYLQITAYAYLLVTDRYPLYNKD